MPRLACSLTRVIGNESSTRRRLKQRVFGLCLGYEDLNDHAELRQDLLLQPVHPNDCTPALLVKYAG
jgi:hypothetical protein